MLLLCGVIAKYLLDEHAPIRIVVGWGGKMAMGPFI